VSRPGGPAGRVRPTGRVLSDLRELGGDAGLVSLGQIVSYAYPIVSIPLLSRVLGIEGLGLFIVTLAVIQMLLVLTDFGFGFSALRRTAVADTAAERQAVASATITAKLALWAVGSVVLVLVVLAVPSMRQHLDLYLVGVLVSVGAALYPMWYLQGTGRLKLYALLTGGSRVVALAGLVLTVRSADQLGLAVFWQLLPYPLSAAVCWAVMTVQKDVALRLSRSEEATKALYDSLPLFVSLIGGQLIVISSAILLGQLAGYRQAGLYGPADRLTSAILGVLVAVEQAILPRLAAAHERPQEINQPKLILASLMGCYGLAGLLLAVAAPVLIPWYLGADFADAVPIVQLMGVATVVTGVTRTFALNLIAADRSGVCSIVTTIGAGWHLVTAALGALIGGAEGVVVAICGTQLFMGAAMGYAIRQGPRRPGHHRAEPRRAFQGTREQQR
jgi:polysaccharide transporter, PST family